MLLGGNQTDHTFLMDNLQSYLTDLKQVGGNYIRNVMSQREENPENRPHKLLENGKYDLTIWNSSYWNRFEETLKLCQEKDIIVSIELWDKMDYNSKHDRWLNSCWHPDNNVNYTFLDSKLPNEYNSKFFGGDIMDKHNDNPFLRTVPGLDSNALVLSYQEAFIDQVLSYSLKYPNIIYNIDNEWKESPEWSEYWARYIKNKAKEVGKDIHVTEMVWSLSETYDPKIDFVIQRDDLFSFCGFRAGQPFVPLGEDQYNRIMEIRGRVEISPSGPRPLNEVKVRTPKLNYSHSKTPQARVWRAVLAGWSAISTHRVHNNSLDMGFTDVGKTNIRALRAFTNEISPWECEPQNNLLTNRTEDEAYLMANLGVAYGFFFTSVGSVGLDLSPYNDLFQLKWISIETGLYYGEAQTIKGGQITPITTPHSGSKLGWAATIVKTL